MTEAVTEAVWSRLKPSSRDRWSRHWSRLFGFVWLSGARSLLIRSLPSFLSPQSFVFLQRLRMWVRYFTVSYSLLTCTSSTLPVSYQVLIKSFVFLQRLRISTLPVSYQVWSSSYRQTSTFPTGYEPRAALIYDARHHLGLIWHLPHPISYLLRRDLFYGHFLVFLLSSSPHLVNI